MPRLVFLRQGRVQPASSVSLVGATSAVSSSSVASAITVFASVLVVVVGLGCVALFAPLGAARGGRVVFVRRIAVPVDCVVERLAARLALFGEWSLLALDFAPVHLLRLDVYEQL